MYLYVRQWLQVATQRQEMTKYGALWDVAGGKKKSSVTGSGEFIPTAQAATV